MPTFVRWCVVEAKLAFLEEQVKMFARNAIVFAKHSLSLVPEVFNAIDVVPFARRENVAVVDAMMVKL